MTAWFPVAVLALALCSCVTEQERQAQAKAQVAQIEAMHDQTCKSYGLKFGTPAYAECRQKLLEFTVNALTAQQAAQAYANVARSQALSAAGQSLLQNAGPRPLTPTMQTMTCRPNVFGSVTCNSF